MEENFYTHASSSEKCNLYYHNLFQGLVSARKTLLFALITIYLADTLEIVFLFPEYLGNSERNGFEEYFYLYYILSIFLFYFSIFKQINYSDRKTYHIRLFLLTLSNIIFGATRLVNINALLRHAIAAKEESQWLFQIVVTLNQTYLCFLADLLNPIWYLKLIIPLSVFIPLLQTYHSNETVDKRVIWVRFISIFIFLLILLGIKTFLDWQNFLRSLDLEAKNKMYQKLLENTSDAVVTINTQTETVYKNPLFKKLFDKHGQGFMTKFTDLRKLRQYDPSTEFTYTSFRNETRNREDDEVHRIIPIAPREHRRDSIFKKNEYSDLAELCDAAIAAFKEGYFSSEDFFVYHANVIEPGDVCTKDQPEQGVDNGNQPINKRIYEIKIVPLIGYDLIAVIITDFTYKELAESLEIVNEHKDKILASVSHDLRTPLNASINFLEMSINEGGIPEQTKENWLVPAFRSCKFLALLVNDILDFSQMKAQKLRMTFEKLSIAETIRNCRQLLEIQARKKGLKFPLEIDPTLPSQFSTDHNRVGQVILNLLSNAVKFTFKGEVRLRVVLVKQGLVKVEVSDTGIGIKESDQRKLFQDYTRIEYEKTDINTRGVGLGLVIANQLASKLGPLNDSGIKVYSKYGEGTRFWFLLEEKKAVEFKSRSGDNVVIKITKESSIKESDLPVLKVIRLETNSSDPAEEMPGSRAFPLTFNASKTLTHVMQIHLVSKQNLQPSLLNVNASPTHTQGTLAHVHPTFKNFHPSVVLAESQVVAEKTALVVDDDPMNIMVLETLLKKLGLNVDSALNGEEAIEKLKKGFLSERNQNLQMTHNIIFMDCQMPIMDGFEASLKINEMIKDNIIEPIAIIGCTGHEVGDNLEKCLKAGMKEVITKPISKEKLEKLLAKYG